MDKKKYPGTYDDQIRETYERISGRDPFTYDPSKDPLYKMAQDRYTQLGKLAMKDTMGQAAALTGGFGNTYGQSVGQQAYNAQLQKLGGEVPELYKLAYTRYANEGEDLKDRYNMLRQLQADEYGRYRDEIQDQRYEDAQAREQSQTAYAQILNLISKAGYSPTEDELKAAGMSAEQAEALRQSWIASNPLEAYIKGLIDDGQFYQLTGTTAPGTELPVQTEYVYYGGGGGGGQQNTDYGTGGGSGDYGKGLSKDQYDGIIKTIQYGGNPNIPDAQLNQMSEAQYQAYISALQRVRK